MKNITQQKFNVTKMKEKLQVKTLKEFKINEKFKYKDNLKR